MRLRAHLPVRGADISHLRQIEDCGGRFFHDRTQQDPLAILAAHGINYLRLKLWHTPGPPESGPAGYNGLPSVLEEARRIKRAGCRLLLDFHYSDWWADPGKQTPPRAWRGLSFDRLCTEVREYTARSVHALCAAGAAPDMVQVGNEIDNGLLWDDGRLDGSADGYDRCAALLKNGIAGLRAGAAGGAPVKIMIHRANGCDRDAVLEFFDNLFERGVETDVIGFSFYPFFHGSFRRLRRTLREAAVRYRKDIIVVETAWGWTHENGDDCPNMITEPGPVRLPFSARGQARFLLRLARLLRAIPGNRGRGFFYWEPCFIPVPGAGYALGKGDEWDNMTLFDFKGNALPSLDVFRRL